MTAKEFAAYMEAFGDDELYIVESDGSTKKMSVVLSDGVVDGKTVVLMDFNEVF